MRPLTKTIDTAALLHNWHALQKQAGAAKLTAVVKANAYGHGAVLCAKTLAPHAASYSTACIEEALELRQAGITQPIILLEGIFAPDEIPLCAQQNFYPVIHSPRQLEWLAAAPNLTCWLKIDSGMHRLGFPPEQASISKAAAVSHIRWQGILSHFACADAEDLTHARAQLAVLNSLMLPAGWQRCFANSAALYALPEACAGLVRPGIFLYGLSPFAHGTAADFGLKPVMALTTEILALRHLPRGGTAGYGQGFTAPDAGTLATIALGYGDGFNRSIDSGRVHVRINGKNYPLVGRIAMDMSLVWLGNDSAAEGGSVTIFGAENPAENVAREASTIPYTLTTMLTPRVHSRSI